MICSLIAKILPVAYGVNKLQIGCVVEDDKVNSLMFFFVFY
jgi:translation elongation factor EF-1beta